MLLNKKFAPAWILLWVVGLIILSNISYNLLNVLQIESKQTFNPLPVLWAKQVIVVVLGFYASIIFVEKWRIHFNPTLFWFAAIPFLILSFAYPLTASPDMAIHTLVAFWLYKAHSFDVFGILAGLSLSLSLFSSKRD